MIEILFPLIFAEMALIVIFVFKTPLRKLVIMGLDRVKRGRGPIVVKTVAGTVFVVMISSVYSIMKIQKRWIDDGDLNPTDQILLSKHLLEASLMGFSLFLGLMIDRLHHYIRELRIRRKSIEAVKNKNQVFEDGKTGGAKEIKALEEEKIALKAKICSSGGLRILVAASHELLNALATPRASTEAEERSFSMHWLHPERLRKLNFYERRSNNCSSVIKMGTEPSQDS
ncbi:B-cell receptor-associated protein 31-like protein [Actinidia rufa]|uniref:Endoplasmic reticulum transmembrane protein n=1 Tax=Actinidia rufa TaxID=165716 RepID=A0A7J0G6D5_9ERIC|nr:B-cell receptor-associated protein 31-like protein [Actinidia rufa]